MSIDVQNISYEINNNQILKNVSLKIDQGKICSILGPNGSGKSTLVKVISGDLKPQNGFIFFNDRDLKDISIGDRAKIRSAMSQSQQIFFDLVVSRGSSLLPDQRSQSERAARPSGDARHPGRDKLATRPCSSRPAARPRRRRRGHAPASW